MNETSSHTDKTGNTKRSTAPVIEVQNLSKSFDDKIILKDISFQLGSLQNFVILGRSGTGKSVLLKCIVGLLKHDNGTLKVLDREVEKLDYKAMNELRRDVGYLFQGGALYDAMSVRQNLEFPLKRLPDPPRKAERRDMVEEALEDVGLAEALNKMPAELSGGMKKRIALARTLILKPKIMLYDEPTTGLDTVTSQEISNLMLKMKEKFGISSLTITHDLSCTRITGNRVFILHKGKFLAEGTYDELQNAENKLVRSFFDNK